MIMKPGIKWIAAATLIFLLVSSAVAFAEGPVTAAVPSDVNQESATAPVANDKLSTAEAPVPAEVPSTTPDAAINKTPQEQTADAQPPMTEPGMANELQAGEATKGPETQSLNLTVQQAVAIAAQKNLDVKASLYGPAMAEADVRGTRGIYDPRLTLVTDYKDSTTLSTNLFLGNTYEQQTWQLNPGITQLLPTGGTVSVVFNNSWTHNTGSFYLNKYWQSDITASLSQPLLKNFGREATNLNIEVAKFNKVGSLEQFRTKLLNVVAQVRNEYFKLYSLKEDLAAKRVSLELANKVLDDTKGRVRAGVLPAMETLNAEFGVFTREKQLMDSYRSYQDELDVLRLLLQLPPDVEVNPIEVPTKDNVDVPEDTAIKKALAERPDLQQARVGVKTDELQSRVARNRTLPDLKLTANAGLTGLGDTYHLDLDRVTTTKYPVWEVALQFTYPIGNREARNDYVKSRLKTDQDQTQLKNQEQTVENQVKSAIRGLRANYKNIEVTQRGREYAEERLRAFIRKNEVGLATTKDVLDVENDLTTAKSNETAAIADYNNSITSLWLSTGELLEKMGVQVTEKDANELYKAAD